jgi:hypothetical protein
MARAYFKHLVSIGINPSPSGGGAPPAAQGEACFARPRRYRWFEEDKPMPKLIRLYIVSCAVGFGISAVFTVLLLYFNVANIGYLVGQDPMGWLAVAMIWLFNGSIFGAVQFAWKIMQMRDDEETQGPHGGSRVAAFMKAQEATIDVERDLEHLDHQKLVYRR